MVRKLIIGVVLTVALSVAAGSAYSNPLVAEFGIDGAPGLFCEVEKVDVCVMAQTQEDCMKLGGVKAEKCEAPEKKGK